MIKKYKNYLLSQNGLVAMPAIVVLSIIMLAIGIAMSFSSYTQNNISFDNYKSQKAYYIAEAGIKDATMKITRNKNYNTGYSLSINSGTASIVFDESIPNQTKITSAGSINNYTKKIQATLNVTNEGKVTIMSWRELSI
jgi:hypothetical protein